MELIGRYSNPDDWEHFTDTAQAPEEPAVDTETGDEMLARPSSCSRRPRPVVDRLGETDVRKLLLERRSGVMQRALAERYGISLSSVKRILRHNRFNNS